MDKNNYDRSEVRDWWAFMARLTVLYSVWIIFRPTATAKQHGLVLTHTPKLYLTPRARYSGARMIVGMDDRQINNLRFWEECTIAECTRERKLHKVLILTTCQNILIKRLLHDQEVGNGGGASGGGAKMM
jgi:hypothetical protein